MNVITFGGARHGHEAELSNHQFERLFDQQDANELVPTLEVLVGDLQAQSRTLREHIRALVHANRDLETMRLKEIVEKYPDLQPITTRMSDIAEQIESLGCILKDIDQGLIDFPCEIGDEVVFLCWQFGESQVVAWHPVEGGYADRKPIRGVRKTYIN
jgi:hypothetical protein